MRTTISVRVESDEFGSRYGQDRAIRHVIDEAAATLEANKGYASLLKIENRVPPRGGYMHHLLTFKVTREA